MATQPAEGKVAADVSPAADWTAEDVRAGPRPWVPPTFEKFDSRMRAALADVEDLEYRLNLGLQCRTLICRAWHRRAKSTQARSQWNWFRYAGAVIPVLAVGAGGSLLSHLHGTAGLAIGLIALIGGLVGAAINAVAPWD